MGREVAHKCGEWSPTGTNIILPSDSLLNLKGTYTFTDERVAAFALFFAFLCAYFLHS